MLTPQQVIPFLTYDDDEVRRHAVTYLAGAHDPSPATADDFWRAIDTLGPQKAGSHLDRLELLPQTDDSVAKTLEALKTFGVRASLLVVPAPVEPVEQLIIEITDLIPLVGELVPVAGWLSLHLSASS